MLNSMEEPKMIHALFNCSYRFGCYYGLHSEQRKIIFRGGHNWKVNSPGTSSAVHTTNFKRKQGDYQRKRTASTHLFAALVSAILSSGVDAAIASPLNPLAFELSTFLSLGEKWLILSPLVVILIIWKMSRSSGDIPEDQYREGGMLSLETEEVNAKRQRVVKELERLKLKTRLLNEVYSLGKFALQTSGEQESRKRQVDEIIERLQEISKTNQRVEFNDSISFIKSMHEIDGDWCLIYVSRIQPQISDRETLQLSLMDLLDLLGMGVRMGLEKKQQKLSHKKNQLGSTDNKMLLQNTAEMRLDSLAHMEIALRGTWENLPDGCNAVISFDTLSVRPLELFGRRIREDILPFSFPVPSFLQMITEWELIYLDDDIRVNKAKNGALLVFRKA